MLVLVLILVIAVVLLISIDRVSGAQMTDGGKQVMIKSWTGFYIADDRSPEVRRKTALFWRCRKNCKFTLCSVCGGRAR